MLAGNKPFLTAFVFFIQYITLCTVFKKLHINVSIPNFYFLPFDAVERVTPSNYLIYTDVNTSYQLPDI